MAKQLSSSQHSPVTIFLSLIALVSAVYWINPIRLVSPRVLEAFPAWQHPPVHSNPGYRARIYSTSPLVIYIENFVQNDEAKHLVDSNLHLLAPAKTYRGLNKASIDTKVRDASMATLDPKDDPIMSGVVSRAMDFHGRRPTDSFESAVLQRYTAGGHFRHHNDCFPDSTVAETGGNRVSTFLVYLEANCTGGGTNFPRLPRPDDKSWCEFVDCDEGALEGTTFKTVAGNAVYWVSLKEDGWSDPSALHSGTPVHQGAKTILNIWSWRELPDFRAVPGTHQQA